MKDLRAAKNSTIGKCFSSVVYSADGTCVLAGGRTKYLCMYAVAPKLLLRRWQLSHNRSLDAVVDKLRTDAWGEGGRLADIDHSDGEGGPQPDDSLPGVTRGDMTSRKTPAEIRSKCVRFSPSGNAFSAASTEGLVVYSLDPSLTFAPFELDEDVTPATVAAAQRAGEHAKALVMALHLNERSVLDAVVDAVPVDAVGPVCQAVPVVFLQPLMDLVAAKIAASPHVEFFMRWSLAILQHHGRYVQEHPAALLGSVRQLQKSVLSHRDALAKLCDDNTYTLMFLTEAPPEPAVEVGAGAGAGAGGPAGSSS